MRGGLRGTVGWLDGMLFASRPVGESSIAIVKVDGIEGVPVRRSNQVVAVTDASGLAFVPGLLPWQKNQIEIDPVDLPLDAEVATPQKQVVPRARSGVLVDMGVRRTRQALLALTQRNGDPVPVGATVRLLPAGPSFLAGRRGEVWLTDLAARTQPIRVAWPGGGCLLDLVIPPEGPAAAPARIGPLRCTEEGS